MGTYRAHYFPSRWTYATRYSNQESIRASRLKAKETDWAASSLLRTRRPNASKDARTHARTKSLPWKVQSNGAIWGENWLVRVEWGRKRTACSYSWDFISITGRWGVDGRWNGRKWFHWYIARDFKTWWTIWRPKEKQSKQVLIFNIIKFWF